MSKDCCSKRNSTENDLSVIFTLFDLCLGVEKAASLNLLFYKGCFFLVQKLQQLGKSAVGLLKVSERMLCFMCLCAYNFG
jgi:hypothetical protein